MKISIVTPIYKAEKIIPLLVRRIQESMLTVTDSYEIILVNDGSPDDAWKIITELVKNDEKIRGIDLSRNFGQHYALTAGLDYSSGDWIVVMDCDLQENPAEIESLFRKVNEGFDVVFARRLKRKDKFLKGFLSRCFYAFFDYWTDNKSDNTISNFGIYSRKVIDTYLSLKERTRLFPLMIQWLGFKTGYISVEHSPRMSGRSSYTYLKLINLALDAIISRTNKPLRMSIKLGFIMSFLSLIYLGYLIFQKLYFNVSLGWTSLMVSIFFIGGLLFANLGLIGVYLGKIYDEVKGRPIYVVREVVGDIKLRQNV